METILIGTGSFLGIFLIAAFFISESATKDVVDVELKSSYRYMSFGLTFLAVFLMWLMWISVFMHQLNPMIQPQLEKHD